MTDPLDALDGQVLGRLADKSVLVTGGAGFVGSHIASALTELCDVTVLDDLTVGSPENVPDGAELVGGDVRDPEAIHETVSDADVVFHQAALADVGTANRKPVEAFSRNASGAVSMFEAARFTDTRIVFASSAAVYGHPESLPVRETDRKRPESPYGIAKLAADQYARAYANLYDVPTVVLRYFNIYGPERGADANDVVSSFVGRAQRDEPLRIHGDGTQTRDFVHVDDVVQANLRAAVTDTIGRAYNVGTGHGVSIRSLAERVRSATDSSSDVVHVDPRPGDIDHSRADIERARANLGYEPTVDIDEGLRTVAGGRLVPDH